MDPENKTNDTIVFNPWKPIENQTILTLILTILVLITLGVIFGNALLITSVFRTRALRTPSNVYLVSMAFVDMTFGVAILPLNIGSTINGQWSFDKVTCQFWIFFAVTCITTSIFHICLIALDRYRSITNGVDYIRSQTLGNVLLNVTLAFMAALCISIPPFLNWDPFWLKDFNKTRSCHGVHDKSYVLYSFICVFLLPLVILMYLYFKIYRGIQERLRGRKSVNVLELQNSSTAVQTNNRASFHDGYPAANLSNDDLDSSCNEEAETVTEVTRKPSLSQAVKNFLAKKQNFSIARERNATKTLAIVTSSFFICWCPYALAYICVPFIPKSTSPSSTLLQAATWFGYSSAAINPIVYTVFNPEFRKAFKRILTCQRIKRMVAANVMFR